MVGDYIKYTCKKCGWQTRILKEWSDLKPKRCMNRKCNTSFVKDKEALLVDIPQEHKQDSEHKKDTKKKINTKKKKDDRRDEQTDQNKDS